MLDSRTSLPTERAQRAAVHTKGAGLLEALTARPAQPDGPELRLGSFEYPVGSPRNPGVAGPCRRGPGVRRRLNHDRPTVARPPQRDSDTKDEAADAAAQDASQRTDRPDVQDSAPADHQAGNADAPEPKDPSSMDASQPTADAAASDSAQQATVAAAAGVAGASSAATAADAASPAASTDDAAGLANRRLPRPPARA